MNIDRVEGFLSNLLNAVERQLGALKHLQQTVPAAMGLEPALMASEQNIASARQHFEAVMASVRNEAPEPEAAPEVTESAAAPDVQAAPEEGVAPEPGEMPPSVSPSVEREAEDAES